MTETTEMALPEMPAPVAEHLAKVTAQRDEYKKAYLDLLVTCRNLERGILFQGRERVLEDGVTLSLLEMLTGQSQSAQAVPVPVPDPPKQTVCEHERAKPTGRKPLPEKLPRVDVEILPPEVEAQGRENFEQIGEDVTETVERRPGSLVVVRVHRPKFVRKDREHNTVTKVEQAPPPELPIPRGLAGPGLLADTIVKRWDDHLPLHRQERIFGREGLELSRSTICHWHSELAALAKAVVDAMWQDARQSPYLHADATGVLVQHPKKCRNGHFFVVAAPERHILFGYSPKHNAETVDELFQGYKGYLVADAHAIYDHLYRSGNVVECGCWAHTRRYFFKSLGSDPERAKQGIALIGKLFELERLHKTSPPDNRLTARKAISKSVADDFFAWCDRESMRVLDETPISKAIQYARNQREALLRFLDDGRLPIHNNLSERELRREAVGRNNWLFVGSDEGGETNATFVSLIASCHLHKLEPAAYLRDLFCLLPGWNFQNVLELSPLHWSATVARPEVQRLLAENVYRRASLGETNLKR
jgi:transposase